MIEMDASKISDRYKIVPVDYWHYPGRKHDPSINSDETEERIIARNPHIPNAKNYIIAVHIYIPAEKEKLDEFDTNRRRFAINKINRIAQSGVDYYIYDDIKYFTVLRREKAHKLEGSHQYELTHSYGDGLNSDYYAREDKKLMDIVDWLIDPSSDIAEKNRYRLERSWSWQETYNIVDSDIHNDRTSDRPLRRQALHKLSEYQRKRNMSLQDITKDAYERARELKRANK
jgi:hypothetical protein